MRRTLTRPSLSPSLLYNPIYSPPSFLKTFLHTSPLRNANLLPITATGPPPAAPLPSVSESSERRKRQAELLARGQDMRAQMKPGTTGVGIKKRFWKDVFVKREGDGGGDFVIYLDTRPVRNPSTKLPLRIPASKPHLATAIAIEWDNLESAQQALRSHLIPLTSIVSRAHDIAQQDASSTTSNSTSSGISHLRSEIITSLLRYLDTDTLLCWAPPPSSSSPSPNPASPSPSLRDLQIRVARPIIAYLTQHIWPGIDLIPTLDAGSIHPAPQPEASRAVIQGWMAGLPAWELAGLERAVLAGKSLCVGARLVVEWSEVFQRGMRGGGRGGMDGGEAGGERGGEGEEKRTQQRFGIEEAAEACSVEVRWQTRKWGEVEDTHDVEREDLRRQFGSVVLVVSGGVRWVGEVGEVGGGSG